MITTSNSSSKQQIIVKGLKKYLEAQRKAYIGWGVFAEPGVFKQVEPKPEAEKLSPDTESEESKVHRSQTYAGSFKNSLLTVPVWQ